MPEFVDVTATTDIPPGAMKGVSVGLRQVLVANIDGTFYAMNNRCGHMNVHLSDGWLEGPIVGCPLHGARFDVRTAQVHKPAAEIKLTARQGPEQGKKELTFLPTYALEAYEVKVESGRVLVKL